MPINPDTNTLTVAINTLERMRWFLLFNTDKNQVEKGVPMLNKDSSGESRWLRYHREAVGSHGPKNSDV
jgi:hypothetical protein